MPAVVRLLALWLIALSIPVQGMAAVVMPLCPPAHHSDGLPAPDRLADPHGADAPAALSVDHAAHPGTTADRFAHPAHDHGTAPDGPGHAGHSMLECCSAACALSGVVPPNLVMQAPASCAAPPHAVAPLHLGVTPDGLDRPPKSILA